MSEEDTSVVKKTGKENESPLTGKLIPTLDQMKLSPSPITRRKNVRASPLKDSKTEADIHTVNTDDCIPPPTTSKGENKYLLNLDFNSPAKPERKKTDEEQISKPIVQSWMPDILQDESWPELSTDTVQHTQQQPGTNDNPYLTLGGSNNTGGNTMIKNDYSIAREGAAWKKYQSENFRNQLKRRDLNWQPLNDTPEFIPDTFANKVRHVNPSADSLVPSSPLKLFGSADTYTKDRMKNILNIIHDGSVALQNQYSRTGTQRTISSDHEDDQINNILTNSDAIYNGLIRKTPRLASNKYDSNTSITYSASDYTSDADELGTLKSAGVAMTAGSGRSREASNTPNNSANMSTANQYMKNGDHLFNDLKRKLGNAIPKPINEYSDYTSDGDELSPTSALERTSETDLDMTPQDEINPDLTASLDILRQEFNLGTIKKGDIGMAVSAPRIRSIANFSPSRDVPNTNINFSRENQNTNDESEMMMNRKPRGINFIPADNYKDKIYDKYQKKFISKAEYQRRYNNKPSGSETDNDNTMDAFSNFTDTNILPDNTTSILKKGQSSNNKKQQEVSFALPNATSTETEEENSDSSNLTRDLTKEMSFSQSNGALVSAITESYPLENWDKTEQLDIRGKRLDKLRGLDKFTPNVWVINASDNQIAHVSGVPKTVQILNLNHNKFNSLSLFKKVPILQVLELDNNNLENLNCLAGLKNLTRLSLASNSLTSLNGLKNLRMLRYLNVSNNKLRGKLDFSQFDLWLLEDLLINGNRLNSIIGIEYLPDLIYLSADQNALTRIKCQDAKHANLKKISIVMNNFKNLDLSNFPKLKELRADKNQLEEIIGLNEDLEKVSLKYQTKSDSSKSIIKHSSKSAKLRKLALTGGLLDLNSLYLKSYSFSSVTQLVLCAMNLELLPSNFSSIFPMLLDLNLNFNKLTSLEGLQGLSYLRQLKVLSNNVKSIDSIIEYTESSRNSLRLLDMRVNPLTKSIYPYVFYDSNKKEDGIDVDDDDDDDEFDEATTLNLKDYEDIEAFSIEYTKLYSEQGLDSWKKKNGTLLQANSGSEEFVKAKKKYEMKMIVWFKKLVYLDGLRIDKERRNLEQISLLNGKA